MDHLDGLDAAEDTIDECKSIAAVNADAVAGRALAPAYLSQYDYQN